jgi:O-antigen/teichoic acid export membrane protein
MVRRALTKIKGLVEERGHGRFARGIYWNTLGTIFAQGCVFLTAILLARLLGKEVFGELGMIQSTLLTLASIAQVSTGLTATKYVAEFRDADKMRAGRVLGLCSVLTLATGVVATALLLISAPWVAENMLAAPHLAVSLAISAAFVLFSVMNGYQIGALAGLESYKSIAVYGALLGAAHLALCGLGAMLWALHGALGGMAVSALLRWGVYGLVLRREIKKQGITMERKAGLKERDVLCGFTLPAALSGLTTMPAVWLGNAFLVQQPNGYAEMGVYSAAMYLRTIILFFPVLLNGVAVALINSHKGQENKSSFKATFSLNLGLTAAAALMGAILMWFFGEGALKVFGANFAGSGAAGIIFFMSISVVAEAIGIAMYQLIQTHEKMWLSFFAIALPRDVLIVFSAYFLAQSYGGAGLAGAFALGCLWALMTKIGICFKLNLYDRV